MVVFGATTLDISTVGGFEGKLKFTATGYRQAAGHRSRPCAIVILDPEGYGVGPCREGGCGEGAAVDSGPLMLDVHS